MKTGNEVTINEFKGVVKDVLNHDRARLTAINLLGPPGMGKSDTCEQVAAEVNGACKIFLTATMDQTDVVGVPFPDKETGTTVFLPPKEFFHLTSEAGRLLKDIDPEKPVIVIFDDMPSCHPQVFPALHRLLHNRELGNGLKFRDNVLMLATGNRAEDNAGASDIPTALANRFMHFTLKMNTDEWRHWAVKRGVNPNIVGYVHAKKGVALWDAKAMASGNLSFPTPRSVVNASHVLDAMGDSNTALTFKAMSGICGEGWATEFMAFLKLRHKIVQPEDIIKNPEEARLPGKEDIDLTYSTMSTLTHFVKEKVTDTDALKGAAIAEAAITYCGRLPQAEMRIVLAKDILQTIILPHKDSKFRAKVLTSKQFSAMIPNIEKYLKDTRHM